MIKLSTLLEWGPKSVAAQQAAALGLTAVPHSYGQYADASGKVVAKSVDGGKTLVRIEPKEQPQAPQGQERDQALQALKDKTKRQQASAQQMFGKDPQTAGAMSKGIAMRNAAEKRRLMGTQTGREREKMARQKQYTPIPKQSDADWFKQEYPEEQ